MIPPRQVLLVWLFALTLCRVAGAQGGALDTTFGGSGRVFLGLGTPAPFNATSVSVLSDGRMAIGGLLSNGVMALAAYGVDGRLDRDFGMGGSVREDLNGGDALTMLSDGSLVLAGQTDFDFPQRTDFAIVRLLRSGARDPSFGENGRAVVDFGETDDNVLFTAGAIGGAVYAVGTQGYSTCAVARLLSNGQPDTAFDADGRLVLSGMSAPTAIAVDDQGRLLVAGSTTASGGIGIAVSRLNTDGTTDTDYGDGGTATIAVTHGYAVARSMALLPDGRLLVIGQMAVADGYDGLLTRLLPNGTPDPTFGSGGQVPVSFGSRFDGIHSGTLMLDGRIVVTGYRQGAGYDIVVGRRLSDGSPDGSFGDNGQVVLDFEGGTDYAESAAILPDGGVGVVAVAFMDGVQTSVVLRFRQDGELDLDFGEAGVLQPAVINPNATANAVAVDLAGRTYVAGRTTLGGPTSSDYFVARLRPDGRRDPSFGEGGVAIIDFDNAFDTASGLALYPDGSVLVVGNGGAGQSAFRCARLRPDGRLDSTFGMAGRLTIELPGALAGTGARSTVIQSDGRAVIAGSAVYPVEEGGYQIVVARINVDGTLDASFGTAGLATAGPSGNNDRATGLAAMPDGGLLVPGMITRPPPATVAQGGAVRLTAQGTVDSTFAEGGYYYAPGTVMAGEVQPDGRPLLAGFVGTTNRHDFGVFRLLPHGVLDPSFGTGGISASGTIPYDEEANAIALLPDGRIAVAGDTEEGPGSKTDWAVHLLRQNGLLDSSFDADGRARLDFTGRQDAATGVAVLADGRIVVVGSAHLGYGVDAAVARYLVEPTTPTSPGPASPEAGLEVFPNPVHDRAIVRFTMETAGPVRIALLDLLGRELAVIRDGLAAPGGHDEQLETGRLKAGVYILRAVTRERTLTRRVTVVR